MIALVCKSGFNIRTIIFFETKYAAHRFCNLLSLLNVSVSELHGDMSQPMREMSLRKFRMKETEILVATDVAARGLDIPGIRTVINAEMPRTASTYVHRVGRTARAGSGGRAITLVADVRRKIMKEVLRGEGSTLSADGGQVLSRVMPRAVIEHFMSQILILEPQINELGKEERMKKQIDEVQREAEKAENLLLHDFEISSRPARTWHQTTQQKKDIKEKIQTSLKNLDNELLIKNKNNLSAKEKSILYANEDEYRDEEGDEHKRSNKKETHRLSRKKRRRMDALKEMDEDDIVGDDHGMSLLLLSFLII